MTSARVSGALWDDIDRWHAWLTSGGEVLVPGYVCVVRPRFAPVGRPGQDDDHGGHRHHRIDRQHRTRDGTGAGSRWAPRPGSRTQSGAGEPVAKALGGDVALLVGDLARIDDVRRLADQVCEHGPIDAWVHNAGVWVGAARRGPRRTVTRRPLR